MEMDGLSFPRAIEVAAGMAGVTLPGRDGPTEAERAESAKRAQQRAAAEAKRVEQDARDRSRRVRSVKEIWQETQPLKGTPAQAYLEWRCPGLSRYADENLRFHPGLEHPVIAGRHPALVAK